MRIDGSALSHGTLARGIVRYGFYATSNTLPLLETVAYRSLDGSYVRHGSRGRTVPPAESDHDRSGEDSYDPRTASRI